MQYLESGALQEPDTSESYFGVLHLDLDSRSQRYLRFSWSDGLYSTRDDDLKSIPFIRNGSILKHRLDNNAGFLKRLQDPGTGFTHPLKANLTLEDFFVYPDIRLRSLRTGNAVTLQSVSGHNVPSWTLEKGKVVLAGSDDCGKSALARMLYSDFQSRHGKLPLLLDGGSLKGNNPTAALTRSARSAIADQYSHAVVGKFEQEDGANKILIIDDWHKSGFSRAGRAKFLEAALSQYASVVLLVNDVFAIEELSVSGDNPLRSFEHCDIREFGYVLRSRLIRKWHTLGREYTEDDRALTQTVIESEELVNTLIGKNLLPAFPVTVLTILQTAEAYSKSPNMATGSYGQLYEALITASLAQVSRKSVDVGTKYTYISRIAYFLFERGQSTATLADLEEIHKEYHREYKIRLNVTQMLADLDLAQILCTDGGRYRFKYKYIYCYFVAKYFQDNLGGLSTDIRLRTQLLSVVDHIYYEDYANIVIFYVYLTKDRELIEHILQNAKQIYADVEPCDLESHVQFINELQIGELNYLLPSSSVEKNREDYSRRQDESESDGDSATESEGGRSITYCEELSPAQKLNISLKTLRIMGQVLRNFPGVLKADLKFQLAQESYQLGLRTLRAILQLAERDIQGLRTYYSELLKERMALDDDDPKLLKSTDDLIVLLARRLGFAMVKRVSHAVGLKELEETYQDVMRADGDLTSVKVIDLAIKLDHFTDFPKPELQGLIDLTSRNFYAFTLLRDMAANYLYLFPADYRTKQWVGEKLNIKTNIIAYASKSTKKLLS